MRWPWVTRHTYDQLMRFNGELAHSLAQQADMIERSVENTNRAMEMYSALLEKYHSLRTQGANPAPEKPVIQPKEPSPIDWAISEKSGSNAWLRVHLTRYAAEQRQQGKEDGEIIERITRWQSEDDD